MRVFYFYVNQTVGILDKQKTKEEKISETALYIFVQNAYSFSKGTKPVSTLKLLSKISAIFVNVKGKKKPYFSSRFYSKCN